VLPDKAENSPIGCRENKNCGETSLLDDRVVLGVAPAAAHASVATNVDCNAASIAAIDNRTIVRKSASPGLLTDGW